MQGANLKGACPVRPASSWCAPWKGACPEARAGAKFALMSNAEGAGNKQMLSCLRSGPGFREVSQAEPLVRYALQRGAKGSKPDPCR